MLTYGHIDTLTLPQVQGKKLRVSVHETTSAAEALTRTADFQSAMETIKIDEELDDVLFFVTAATERERFDDVDADFAVARFAFCGFGSGFGSAAAVHAGVGGGVSDARCAERGERGG